MMPNKVYVRKEKDNVIYSLSVQYNNGGVEYIRKDALLEWAKEINDNTLNDTMSSAMEMLIDKLNSM